MERVADNRLFLLNSARVSNQQSNPKVFCGSVKNKLSWNNATCEEESIPASTSGLLATERYSNSKARFVASAYSNAQILLDANGHVRPIQSFYRLRSPFPLLSTAFECLSLSRITIHKQEYIGLLCLSKKRGLVRAIEEANLSMVKELTEHCIHNFVASGPCDVACQVKRPKLSSDTQAVSSDPGEIDLRSAHIFLERSCGNRNILHTSIRTAESNTWWSESLCEKETPSCILWNKSYEKYSFEEVRWKNCSKQRDSISPLSHTETETAPISILSYLISVPALSAVVRYLLCERDVSGCTPLMLALKKQDLPAASLILDYVENMPSTANSLRHQSHLFQNAIALPCLENQFPIQALLFNAAIPHCEFGLNTLLLQATNFSSVTPRSLLSFIQTRYPSAYRCEMYEKTGAPVRQTSMVLSQPFLRQTRSNLKLLSKSSAKSGGMFASSATPIFLVAFNDIWEMRDAACELNSMCIASPDNAGSRFSALLSVHQYYGQDVLSDQWKSGVKKSYSKRPADKLNTELQRVTLVRRLLEILPSEQQTSAQEGLLSSILHNKLLLQYLQDMHGLSDTSYTFVFGSKLVSEPVVPTCPTEFLGGGFIQHVNIQAQSEASEQETQSEPEGEICSNTESVVDILANSWNLIAACIYPPGTGNDPCYSHRDSFVLSLILDTPSSIIKSVLHLIFQKAEMLQTTVLIDALRTMDICAKLEEQDAYVVTIVKRFLQSLVRLYTNTIEGEKHFDLDKISPADSTSSLIDIRDRIFSVLRSFRSLAVLELFISAQGLCWPLIAGNLKHYQKNAGYTDASNQPYTVSPGNRSAAVLCHHRRTQLLATAASVLPTLPQRGLKLPFSEPPLSKLSPSHPREKRERSDYWGIDDVSHIASSSDSDNSSDSDPDDADPLASQGSAREPPDSSGSPRWSEYRPESPATTGAPISTEQGQYGPRRARISWLVDGLENTIDTYQYQNENGLFHHYGSQRVTQTFNTLNGGVVLARTFSRLLKSALKLLLPPSDAQSSGEGIKSDTDRQLELPRVSLTAAMQSLALSHVPELLDPVFNWAGKLLDLAENQLEQGKRFKLDSRYTHTLSPGDIHDSVERQQRTNLATPLTQTGSYTNYLLCLNSGEASTILPVIDIQAYEHVAFILDAQLYFLTNWLKCPCVSPKTPHTPSAASDSRRNATDQWNPDNFFLRQSSLIVSKHKHQQLTEPDFKTPLKLDIPLAQKPHLLKPETSNTTLFSAPSHTPTAAPHEKLTSTPSVLSYSQLEAKCHTSTSQLTSQDLTSRWRHVIQAFVDVFVSTGPSSEPDNFLIARAGFSGKKARFYLLIGSPNVSMFGSASVHLQIDRSQLLKDSLSKIFSTTFDAKGQVGVSFEGEPGGGIGVVAGFYTALANALKSDEKLPAKTASLFHEPGKIPEQATFYTPTPTLLTKENPLFVQRLTYYRVRSTASVS